MSRSRGLTLLEVLLATALLGTLAAITAPLLLQARTSLEYEDNTSVHVQLNDFIDKLLEDPGAFGIDDLHGLEYTTLDWPASLDSTPVTVQSPTVNNKDVDSTWIAVRWHDSVVLRRIKQPSEIEAP